MTEPKKDDWGEFGPEIAELEGILGRLESDAKSLIRETTAPPPTGSPNVEVELASSRDSVSNLLVRMSRERRDARAAMLAVKRRLRSFRRSGKLDRVAEVEQELAEARQTIASLLREATRRDRRTRAEALLRNRKTRKEKPATTEKPEAGAKPESRLTKQEVSQAVGSAATSAAHHLETRLRALISTPPRDVESLTAEAEECRRLALILRLAFILESGFDTEQSTDVKKIIEARLDLWEEDFRRQRATLVREYADKMPQAAIPSEELAAAIDALVGRALSRVPRGGIVLVRIVATAKIPLQIDVQDNGNDAPAIASIHSALSTGKRMTALEVALTHELADRWKSSLESSPATGRGLRLSLTLPTR